MYNTPLGKKIWSISTGIGRLAEKAITNTKEKAKKNEAKILKALDNLDETIKETEEKWKH